MNVRLTHRGKVLLAILFVIVLVIINSHLPSEGQLLQLPN